MKIIYRISLNVDSERQNVLATMGIVVNRGFQTFLVDEGGPLWKQMEKMVSKWKLGYFTETKFSSFEIKNAFNLRLIPTWHYGYPQPDADFGYLNESFSLDKYCEECGIGYVQNNVIYLKNKPRWGSRKIFQLYWLYDEYFVEYETYKDIFEPMGIGYWDVAKWRGKETLKDVVQLKIEKTESRLDLKGYKYEECKRCGQIKYHPITRGFYPKLVGEEKRVIFKTREYFGSGAQAFNSIIISKSLYERITIYKLKGVGFYPLAK